MRILKGIGYTLASILVLIVLLLVGSFMTGIVIIGGVLLSGATIVAIVAYAIKDFFDSRKSTMRDNK